MRITVSQEAVGFLDLNVGVGRWRNEWVRYTTSWPIWGSWILVSYLLTWCIPLLHLSLRLRLWN